MNYKNTIYDILKTSVNSNPEENYDIMFIIIIIMLLATAKEKHLLGKMVKFDKRKHKKAKWMTNNLLKSINTKDTLYKKLIKNKYRQRSPICHFEN